MKRLLFVGLIVVVGFCFVSPQTSSAQIEEKVPKGIKTKTVIAYIFEYKGDTGVYQKTLLGKFILVYDREGKMIEQIDHAMLGDRVGEISCKQLFSYDKKGDLIEYATYSSDEKLSSKVTFKYKYDKEGNRIEEGVYYTDGNSFSKSTYKYDQDGNKVEQAVYGADNKLLIKHAFKYDKDGNLIESYKYKSDGALKERWVIRYNEDGQEIEAINYRPDGKLDYKYTSKYDKAGNLIEKIGYHSNKRPFDKSIFEYDKDNNLIKENHYEITWVSEKDVETPKSEKTYEYEFYPEVKPK